jgi:hypothetical protein
MWHRLRSFANSCEVAARLLLQALLKKAEYLNAANTTRVTAFTYLVPSERSDEKYEVDISVDICMCEADKHGKFCEHQAGILRCFSILPPNAPRVTAEARHRTAAIASSIGIRSGRHDLCTAVQKAMKKSVETVVFSGGGDKL